MKHKLWVSVVLIISLFLTYGLFVFPRQSATAQASPTWPTISIKQIASGFNLPVGITNAGDGSKRLFVLEQAGLPDPSRCQPPPSPG